MTTRNAVLNRSTETAEEDERIHRNAERFAGGLSIRGGDGLASISQAWTIRALDPDTYTGRVDGWHHGRLMVTHSRGDAVVFHRSRAHLGDGHDRHVQICLIKTGKIVTRQRGKESAGRTDSLLTLLLDHEFLSTTSNDMDVLLFYVPRSYFEARGINTETMAASVLDRVPVAEAMRTLVASAISLQRAGDDSLRDYLERSILELLTGLGTLFAEGFDLMDKHSDGLRATVLGILEAEYSDPGTSADTLAKAVGISKRQLYRLFEGRNVSVAGMLRERRLDHAELMLRQPGNAPISLIAEASGFNSPDQLSRAMRERHGRSPREYRSTLRSS